MNREYHDGTEPDTLPHYTFCSGPCNQGRKPCPCPVACEKEDNKVGLVDVLVKFIVGVLAFIGLGAIVGWLA